MTSSNSLKDSQQRFIVEYSPRDWNNFGKQLVNAIDELELTFAKMPKPPKAKYEFLCPKPIPDIAPDANQIPMEEMDLTSRVRASKVFNVWLARLWRRRCDEVCDLHDLVHKYQKQAKGMRDDLYIRNKMISREQRRCERLQTELRKIKNTKPCKCSDLTKELAESRRSEEQLRKELQDRTTECENCVEVLNLTKIDMFRELTKFRNCAMDCARDKRACRLIEFRNADLEDEIRTLTDQFQIQNDALVVELHKKQEKLDEAYESLKGFEEELAELLAKHNELIEEYNEHIRMHESRNQQPSGGGVTQHIYIHCPNYKQIAHEMLTELLSYVLQNPLPQTQQTGFPMASMGFCLAIIVLIAALR